MIFSLNTFSFTFSHAHIETSWTARARNFQIVLTHGRHISVLADRRRDRAPLARANLDQLVQQNLIVFVYGQVSFILQEVLRLLPFLSALLQHFSYVAGGFNLLGLARVNLLDLLLMIHELPIIHING